MAFEGGSGVGASFRCLNAHLHAVELHLQQIEISIYKCVIFELEGFLIHPGTAQPDCQVLEINEHMESPIQVQPRCYPVKAVQAYL